MMLECLASAALRSGLLAVTVWFGLSAMRVRSPQLRLAAWTSVLAASLAMPALQRAAPLEIPSIAEFEVPRGIVADEAAAPATQRVAAPATAPTTRTAQSWRAILTAGYCAVAAFLVMRLVVGLGLSWRLLRMARRVDAKWAEGGSVRVSAAIHAPATIFRTVLLPVSCDGWDPATRAAVLAHEQDHVARGDFFVQLLSAVNRAVFWFSPIAWLLHARLAALAELASDDAAVAALGDRTGYAEILLEMARRCGPILRGVAMARPATVGRRIERLLAERAAPARASAAGRAAFALGVAPLALAAAISIAGAAPPDRAALAAQRAPHTPITIDSKLLDADVGFYKDMRTGSIMVVTREGDHLMAHRAGNPPVPEYPYTDHDFFFTFVPQQNTFVADASGAVNRVVHHQGGRDEILERIGADEAQREIAAVEQRLAAERAPHVQVPIDAKLLDNYVGAYRLAPAFMFTITRRGDALFARLTGQAEYEVHPYSDHDFFYTIVAAQLSFVDGPDGKAASVILHQNGRDRTAPRVDPALAEALDRKLAEQRAPHGIVAIDPKRLDAYVGRYRNDDVEITATRRDNQLYVQVTGFNRYAVYPYSDHDFFAPAAPAQISFAGDDPGKATQLIRHQFGVDAVLTRVD